MRLLIVGSLDGHISAAGKIALSRGAKVAHVNDIDQAMHALRNGQGADLVMLDAPSAVHLAYRPGVPLVTAVWKDGRPL